MKIYRYLLFIPLVLTFIIAAGQDNDLPGDLLSAEFHQERREKLREKLPENSVAVFFASPVRNRANDVDYVYHQDPDFYYFTGYREPHAVLLIFKEKQQSPTGEEYHEIIFVQPRDEFAEMWTGRRLGDQGVANVLKIQHAFNHTEFARYDIDFSKFDKVLFYDFLDDVRNTRHTDLYDLIAQFKEKVGYPSVTSPSLQVEPMPQNIDLSELHYLMSQLRGIKTDDEINLLRKAVNISAIGQIEVMKAMRPGMSEREIQGIHEFVFKKYGSEYEGYPSIVGAGHNGCILHYIDNYKPEISNKELILMDLGAEYRGYTADVTRTIPVSGKFSKEQKLIYDLVYEAQERAIQAARPGTSFAEIYQITRDVIDKGLVELGIIENITIPHKYYPHGCTHHIGLDVHDNGEYGLLEENMVITIEPGIYIPEGSPCDKKWWSIAVRIEDDLLITKKGHELLSAMAPRKSEDVEEMMKQPSPLDAFVLPDLDKK